MYTVIKQFIDLQDKNHPYNVGDDFPREGLKVTEERIAELSSSNNKRREPLITLATSQEETKEEPKADPRKCPYCFSVVDDKATRCPHCTSHLE